MELHFYDSLPSTNQTAILAAREGAEEFYTVIAASQSAGRGRLDRSFFSPQGGTYFSTVLRPSLLLTQYGSITPVVAVAVHRALAAVTGVLTDIKWVNDLLLGGRKICGILAESGKDKNGRPFVVVGIGINTADVDFPPELWHIATCIPCEDRTALIGAILAELAEYEQIIRSKAWLPYYREYCTFLGENVMAIEGDKVRHGVAVDILEDGALLLSCPGGGTEALHGGEISLRPAQNYQNRHNL